MPLVFAKLRAMEFMHVSVCAVKLSEINESVTEDLCMA